MSNLANYNDLAEAHDKNLKIQKEREELKLKIQEDREVLRKSLGLSTSLRKN